MQRYLEPYILDDLKKKMVFIGGPRQVGKTTISKTLYKEKYLNAEYFNWDSSVDRKAITKHLWQEKSSLVIFDELHKYPRWKSWIKGIYDTKNSHQQYLVTGSARLDVYRRGGDSLLGRYHYWRLHPLSLDEFPSHLTAHEAYERLLTLGGFPEPFLSGDLREARRWRRDRLDRVLREDIRDLETVRNTEMLSLFIDALKERAGSLVTINNIATDLQVASKTLKSWLEIVQKMYLAFAVYPYTKQLPRAIQKPPKVYFFDNADIADNKAARLENLVATHLLKRLHFLEDYYGYRTQLHYVRDKDGREVDFLTIIDGQITDLIEVKLSDSEISTSLKYYQEKLKPKNTVQIVGDLKKPFDKNGIKVTNPIDYFAQKLW